MEERFEHIYPWSNLVTARVNELLGMAAYLPMSSNGQEMEHARSLQNLGSLLVPDDKRIVELNHEKWQHV